MPLLLQTRAQALSCHLLLHAQKGVLYSPTLHLALVGQQAAKNKRKCARANTEERRGDIMHIRKRAMKTNAREIQAGDLAGYMLWDFRHNWKFTAQLQDGCVQSPVLPSLSSLVRQPSQV